MIVAKCNCFLYYQIIITIHSTSFLILFTCDIDETFLPNAITQVLPAGKSKSGACSSFRWWRGVCRFPTCHERWKATCGLSDAPSSISPRHKQKPWSSVNFLEDWMPHAPLSYLQPEREGKQNWICVCQHLWMIVSKLIFNIYDL